MFERARAWSCVCRPVPTISTRSAPRCSAGLTGAIWRIEPSPKYSRCTLTHGKMKGNAAQCCEEFQLKRDGSANGRVALPPSESAAALEEQHALAVRVTRRGHASR